MTGASAERFKVKQRGVLQKGYAADITIFDWERIKDNNTPEKTDQNPTGIEAVFINGKRVLGNGRVKESLRAGRVL
jgi:N-acyl-D-amino-acid deacylase